MLFRSDGATSTVITALKCQIPMLTLVDALGSFKYTVADAITVGVTAHNSVGSGTRATFTGVTARDVP